MEDKKIDIHAILAERQEIAIVWSIEDVLEVRPDLSDEQAWKVLRVVDHEHDANCGVTWDTLAFTAADLFGYQPEADSKLPETE